MSARQICTCEMIDFQKKVAICAVLVFSDVIWNVSIYILKVICSSHLLLNMH